ncbi:MAG: hypothetical protein ABJE10_14625 [bacterium]
MARTLTLIVTLLGFTSTIARAQSDYYNRDAGRPSRIEDASPTPRYELELQLAPLRFEKLESGVQRWRVEPKMAYGIAPFTDVEIRVPYIAVNAPDSPRKSGIGGIAIGALHAFGLENAARPAFALSGEWIAPVGGLSAPIGSYTIKGIATKTFAQMRVHANVAYGTYSSKVSVCALPRPINVPPPEECAPNVIPFDPPCDRVPAADGVAAMAAQCLARAETREEEQPFDPLRTVGMRWLAGAGIDHAFALSSTLLTADVVAERFAGLFARTDVSAEIGLRHQVTPQLVLEIGAGRHFVGLLRSNSATVGIGYGVATPRLFPHRGPR